MKTPTETKLDRIIKEGFHSALKPIGFKKREITFTDHNKTLDKLLIFKKVLGIQKIIFILQSILDFFFQSIGED